MQGKVGIGPLFGGGALGGWQLAINANVSERRRSQAEQLLRHLSSPKAQQTLALAYGRLPARRDAYRSPELVEGAPFIARLEPAVLAAKPRPVTPYYNLLSDTLQSELSAAVVGVRSPAEALRRAQARADALLGTAAGGTP